MEQETSPQSELKKLSEYIIKGASFEELAYEIGKHRGIKHLPKLPLQDDAPQLRSPYQEPGFFGHVKDTFALKQGKTALSRTLNWQNAYSIAVGELALKLTHLIDIEKNSEQYAFALTALSQSAAKVIYARMMGKDTSLAFKHLLLLEDTLNRNFQEKFHEHAMHYNLEFRPSLRRKNSKAYWRLDEIIRTADRYRKRRDPELNAMHSTVANYLKELDINAIRGVAIGGAVIGALFHLMATTNDESTMIKSSLSFGILVPIKRTPVTFAQEVSPDYWIIQEGGDPSAFYEYQDRNNIQKGNILVIDDSLSLQSLFHKELMRHFNYEESREIFFAANKTSAYSQGIISLTQLFGGNEATAHQEEIMRVFANI